MSVYTCINQQQLEQFLGLYAIGGLVDFSGIKAGMENTNYAVNTTRGKFILTVFKSLTQKQLPCYLQLLTHLCQQGFPAPQPQKSQAGQVLNSLKGKPAALFNCLSGQSIERPLSGQCTEMGAYLATLHLSAQASGFYKKNPKNLRACQAIFNKISARLSRNDHAVIRSELDFQLSYCLPVLPQGVIHADLFRDNVLFEQDRLRGIVDFYNACHDYYVFDIAITVNDWCVDDDAINAEKFKDLLAGYQQIRRLSREELQHLQVFFRLAALRFWISRLEHQLNPREGELVLQKDPWVFRRLLEFHQQHDVSLWQR